MEYFLAAPHLLSAPSRTIRSDCHERIALVNAASHEPQPPIQSCKAICDAPAAIGLRRIETRGASFAARLAIFVSSVIGLGSQPPGSGGRLSRPATTKLLLSPLCAKAAQRWLSNGVAVSGLFGKATSRPAICEVGDWMFTVPLTPNWEEASITLVASARKDWVVMEILPPCPCVALATSRLFCKMTVCGSMTMLPPIVVEDPCTEALSWLLVSRTLSVASTVIFPPLA